MSIKKHLNHVKFATTFDQVQRLTKMFRDMLNTRKVTGKEFEELEDALGIQQHRICDQVYQGTNWFTHNAELEIVNTRELNEFIKPYFKQETNCKPNLATFLRIFFEGFDGPYSSNRAQMREKLSRDLLLGQAAIDYEHLAETLIQYFRED